MIRSGRYGKFIGCSNYPECTYRRRLLKKVGVTCPDCEEGDVVERRTRRGRVFFGCSRYPDCEYTTWTRPRPPPEDSDKIAAGEGDHLTGEGESGEESSDTVDGHTPSTGDSGDLTEVSRPDSAAG